MPGGRAAACALIALVLGSGCTEGQGPPPGPPPGARTLEEMAAAVGTDVLRALQRGYHPNTSTDIAFVPEPYNTVVRWSGEGLGTDLADPRTSHPTPWDYHQRVPILLYGPGWISEGLVSERPVDVTDIAPSFARLVGGGEGDARLSLSQFRAEGSPLREALPSEDLSSTVQPRAIVLIAYDGGGWNLLQQWPDAWPVLRRLMERGTLYTNATIGSAPAVTTAIHANMGTGAYPRTHGIAEITGRLPDGSVGDVFFDEAIDPRLLLSQTLGDHWDFETGNRAWVGMIGYESWHLAMMSHGADQPHADRDVAVLWEQEPGLGEFHTNEELYELPGYLPGDEELRGHLAGLDGEDGELDGFWRGYDLEDPRVVPATPAFVTHQGQALLEIMRREPIGEDDITDLLFVELKPTDFAGHLWNMVAPQEEDVVRMQDRLLGAIVRTLDREVGKGRWVLGFTADHGQTPKPETTGGRRIHPDLLGRAVDEYFGRKLVQKVTPSGLFLDHDALDAAGISLEDVARFVGDYRYGDGLPADVDRSMLSAEELDERVFAAAFPATYLESLTAEEARSFGAGDYPEGNLTEPAPVPYP